MYVLLDEAEQNRPDAYPEWCDLSWFHNCRSISGDVERHYHDAPEIWLWHEGDAEAVVDGEPASLCPGVVVYTPAGCLHSYQQHGRHSNTGIVPQLLPSMRRGHLPPDETGEQPSPEASAFCLGPEENDWRPPAVFPAEAFLRSAYSGQYQSGDTVLRTTTEGWVAILAREGSLGGTVDGGAIEISEPQLLILGPLSVIQLRARTACEVAFAVGWPPEARTGEA